MEFLTPRGPEQIDYWSVSLGQDAIGRPETVKETRLELKRRFALAANVRDEQTAQLKQQAAQIQKVSAQLELTQSGTAAIKRRKASFAQLSEECKNSRLRSGGALGSYLEIPGEICKVVVSHENEN